ncbi:hypothetical protein [Leptospira bandrabouensis]|uniref:Uncharacterized protein n=1 Tax=Leptospira bandrabouensis TaxID=2484903 RepID=A0A6H3NMT4_9LEPT|nr:hypothetical protein [Leptospira bandrabouensis]TGN11604.1 hypothetical protein EHR08_17070 [Leptospira bandrabouensis]
MNSPKKISELRKQILRSYVPSINSLGIIKIPRLLSSQEIVGFFKNANYFTGKLIHTTEENKNVEIHLIFNIERSFLVKFLKSFNLDSFEYLQFNRNSESLKIIPLEYEAIRIKEKEGFEIISKCIFKFSSDKNSFIKEFYKLRCHPKFKELTFKDKYQLYVGKRISFSKEEMEILKEYDEMSTKYEMEIIDRQNLQKFRSGLSESFVWRNRGIINNMVYNLIEIENRYKYRNELL